MPYIHSNGKRHKDDLGGHEMMSNKSFCLLIFAGFIFMCIMFHQASLCFIMFIMRTTFIINHVIIMSSCHHFITVKCLIYTCTRSEVPFSVGDTCPVGVKPAKAVFAPQFG